MKKSILFVAVVFAASFASCKKDYACKCSNTVVPGTVQNQTKKDANDRCEKLSTSSYTCEAEKQ